jgi:hypothetical protein
VISAIPPSLAGENILISHLLVDVNSSDLVLLFGTMNGRVGSCLPIGAPALSWLSKNSAEYRLSHRLR